MSANPPRVPWESQAFISPARMTACTHLALPGTVSGNTPNASISTLNPIYPNMLVSCTETGGGFVKDQTYKRNTDNTAWIGISGGKHLHDVDTDTAGGRLTDIMVANQLKLFAINDLINPTVGNFLKEGGATAVDEIDATLGNRIRLETGASTGAYAHLSRGGVKLLMGQPSQFVFKGHVNNFSGAGNVTSYIGVGLADVAGSNSNVQYGIQVCDSSSTDRTWEMINKNGTSPGTATVPTENVKQSSPRAYRMLYTPGQNCRLWVNNSLAGTNSNAVVTGTTTTTGIRNISIGIRTNTTTTRILYVYGVSLMGTISDSLWV